MQMRTIETNYNCHMNHKGSKYDKNNVKSEPNKQFKN